LNDQIIVDVFEIDAAAQVFMDPFGAACLALDLVCIMAMFPFLYMEVRRSELDFGRLRPNAPILPQNRPYILLIVNCSGSIMCGSEFGR
jgi:hypothetical protein